ncbi:MAG: hypothetical protein QXI60_04755 [Thermofilaceae archaeon]
MAVSIQVHCQTLESLTVSVLRTTSSLPEWVRSVEQLPLKLVDDSGFRTVRSDRQARGRETDD